MTNETIRRPLHPQVQAFIDEADPRRPKLYELEPAAARAQAAGAVALIGPGPAVATVRDHSTTCEFSFSPRASTSPSMRQTSFGRTPTRSKTR